MKRYIKASVESVSAKNLRWLGAYAEALSKVCKASSDDQIQDILSQVGGGAAKYIDTQSEAVKFCIDNMQYIANEYLEDMNVQNAYPEVKNTIVDYLKGLGYTMTKMSSTKPGIREGYIIVPASEAAFQDLRTVASAISKDFKIKPDTGVIGGSWTSYEFKLDGVKFRITYEPDARGSESSIQLTFSV